MSDLDLLIVGGGVAGLAAAREAQTGGRSYRLIEASPRFGGKVRTVREGGFVIEAGPDSFLARKKGMRELLVELGLEKELLPCRPGEGRVYIVQGGKLLELPQGLVAMAPRGARGFLTSSALTLRGRLRFLREAWVVPRQSDVDESVADFVRRRFGQEALARLAEPILAHIHVADPERMSLRACYPQFEQMERTKGSVLRAMAAARRSMPPGASPFWTLREGMGQLVEGLLATLQPGCLGLETPARSIEATKEGFRVSTLAGEEIRARAVLLAVPAKVAAVLVADAFPELARGLGSFRVASLAAVTFGFRRKDIGHPLDGYGFFAPRAEDRTILASTWTSSKFAHRVAGDEVLIRTFVGGPSAAPVLALSDEELSRRVLADLGGLLDIVGPPVLERVDRVHDYPLYDVGHLKRVRELEGALPDRLALCGSALHGVGLPDVIRSGQERARVLLQNRV